MSQDPNAYLASLSGEQAAAALKTDEPVMIIAGAGSGKTRTLVGRFIHLIKPVSEGGLGADPSSIMMVTFTNKAAREMRERILPVIEALRAKNPNMRGGEPWIGTFHGLSLRILRVESQKAGLGSNFSIFDDADSRSLANDVAETLGLDAFDVDSFFRDLDFAKARMLGHELLSQKALDVQMSIEMGEDLTGPLKTWSQILAHFDTPAFTRMYSAYQRALDEQNAVDFSDLMNKVTGIFMENEDVRLSWMSSFRHFMVDEVQDINRAQVAWLNMLTNGAKAIPVPEGGSGNEYSNASDGLREVNTYRLRQFPRATVAFVGDDDQSIYAFRGSEVRVMRDMKTKYPGLDLKFLKQSYRCQPSILSVANVLVANNSGRYGKDIEPADPFRSAQPVIIEEHTTPADEIRRICAEANAHIGAGRSPDQFAVLARTRDLVKAVAKELRAAGLPVTEGKASDIRKSAEVRDAMAFVGFIINPDAETLLRRIINKPSRGLGPTSIARVSRNAKDKGISFINELRSVMNDKVDLPEGSEAYKPAFIRSLKQFGYLIGEIKKEIVSCLNAGDAILKILDMTGYMPELKGQAMRSAGLKDEIDITLAPREFLASLIRASADAKGKKSGQQSIEDISKMDGEDLADKAGQMSDNARRIGNLSILIDQASAVPSLDAFMQEATLEMEQKAGTAGIQVMTIHGSKGLEFDVVRLPFWIDGVFPNSRAIDEGGDAIEEERRLAYVAITRAKEDVRISRSWRINECHFIRQRDSHPSRFIRDIQAAPRSDYRLKSMKANDPAYRIGAINTFVAEPGASSVPDVYDVYGRGDAGRKAAQPAPEDLKVMTPGDKKLIQMSEQDKLEISMRAAPDAEGMDDRPFADYSQDDANFAPDPYNGEMHDFAPYSDEPFEGEREMELPF